MQTKIVAVANQKGGVGKTTTTVNLAACLGELNCRVLVIDLDPQANGTTGLGLNKTTGASLYGTLVGDEDVLTKIQTTRFAGVDMIPSELDLAGSEVEIARKEQYLLCLRKAIQPVVDSGRYDFILIDCPPSLGILTMNALTAANSILMPMQCEYYALEGLTVIHKLIEQLRQAGANSQLDLEGLVMTMYDARINLANAVVKEVTEHFGAKVYKSMIPRNVRLGEAPSHGMPIIAYDSFSKGASAYREFAAEFLSRVTGQPVAPATPISPSSSKPASPAS